MTLKTATSAAIILIALSGLAAVIRAFIDPFAGFAIVGAVMDLTMTLGLMVFLLALRKRQS